MGQRIDDQPPLPRAIGLRLPVLDSAAAAHAEMRAEWRDALKACMVDVQETAAIRMTGDVLDFDGLAGQGSGDIDRRAAIGDDTVAALADMIDDQAFNHGARR
jgi:hypothetical protein